MVKNQIEQKRDVSQLLERQVRHCTIAVQGLRRQQLLEFKGLSSAKISVTWAWRKLPS